jgi:hypothetical protein
MLNTYESFETCYDPRLQRPTTIPKLVRLLVRFLRK